MIVVAACGRRAGEAEDFAGNFFFNGPATVRRKAAFAAQEGLAGVMIWEIGQDEDALHSPAGCALLPEIANVAVLAQTSGWVPGKQMTHAAVEALWSAVAQLSDNTAKEEL